MLSSFYLIEQIHDQKGFVKLGLIDPDKKNDKKSLIQMVPTVRIELTTFSLPWKRSAD